MTSTPTLPDWTLGAAAACCLLTLAGCTAIAKAPPTVGVCYTSNTKIDRSIVYESDCHQTGGTWEERAR